ncbi:hypothetical protein ETB97_004860, partial [Aspergillus alliaceus]
MALYRYRKHLTGQKQAAVSGAPPTVFFNRAGTPAGLGKSLAQKVHSANHSLIATARAPPPSPTSPSNDPNILRLPLDVANPTSITTAINTAVAHFHRIDIVVNNAGISLIGDAEGIPDEARGGPRNELLGS